MPRITTNVPVKNADIIIAWAEGKRIQGKKVGSMDWYNWSPDVIPPANQNGYYAEWRILPEIVTLKKRIGINIESGDYMGNCVGKPNIRMEFNSETGKLLSVTLIPEADNE